ncbi:MAG: metal ABC transporter ATP-binding protein [Gemmatimonadetes bacterium]|nr:metal ABC transporter ATP-binding protein [Gemmatimonadota bacterium]
MSDLVRFDGVSLGYGRSPVLTGVTFAVPEGDFLGVVGPNGSGKTTIIRAMLGTLLPLAGTVTKTAGLRFGYVPQRDQVDSLFPLSVSDVVIMGRYDRIRLGHRPGPDDRRAARQALEQVGVPHLADRNLSRLSGGQKQRVLIARALVGDPNVLVLDEPTNGMDLVSTTQILGLVRDLHDQRGLTVVMVSHALNEVANYVHRIGLVFEEKLRLGMVPEIINEEVLSQVYGLPVEVNTFDGHRVVVTRRPARSPGHV